MVKTINYENILNCLQQIDFSEKLTDSEESLLFKTIIKSGIKQFGKDTDNKKECVYCKCRKENRLHIDIDPCVHKTSGKVKFEWLCNECEKELWGK